MRPASRLSDLPPYLFAQIDKIIEEKQAHGADVISLGIGDPVEPTPPHIIERLAKEANNPKNHQYPSYYGLKEFRESIARWYQKRFKVQLDPETEILPLIGSKEGIAHISWAFVDPIDVVLVPDPGYPVYKTGAILSEGKPHFLTLREENQFLPDFSEVDGSLAKQAKLLFLNFPNNPTSAIATLDFFEQVAEFAREHQILVCHDNAYSEITYDGYIAPSFLEVEGAKEVGIEFHSLSKTYNMTGWRCGFAVGNALAIEALGKIKTNIDSGIFNPIQLAGTTALDGPQDCVKKMCDIYKKRREMVEATLERVGLKFHRSPATIYVWVKVPENESSASFATRVLNQAAVVVSPGNAYGPSGEGYIRISLTVKDERLREALARLEKLF